MADATRPQPLDSVRLTDGSSMQIARLPDVDESTWSNMKSYLETNPEIARGLQSFSKNPEAMRGWLQTQAIAEHYQGKSEGADEGLRDIIQKLERDPELKQVFEEVGRNGLEAAMKFWDHEDLLLKISDKMGGIPPALRATLNKIDDTPLSFHEAAKKGDMKAVAEYLRKGQHVDSRDINGHSPLAFAIGGNSLPVVKSLLEARAQMCDVDSKGSSGLHFAAGYGRKELTEYLLGISGVKVNQTNAAGQTPLSLASVNRHDVCAALLVQRGAGA